MAEIRKIKIPTEQSPRDLIDVVSIVDVTQAQYDALPATKTSDGKRYYITDQYKIMHNGVAYGGGGGGTPSASNVTYDGTTSGLQATNVQSAIDEEVANTASSFSSVTTALGTKANVLDLAPAFSTSTAYAVGDYVIYEGHLYKCTTAHAAGAWVAADFAEADVCTEKADKVSNATNGNFAGLDSDGNLIDSGHKHSDYLTSLPIASANDLGGIKVGTNLSIDANGVLSATGGASNKMDTDGSNAASTVAFSGAFTVGSRNGAAYGTNSFTAGYSLGAGQSYQSVCGKYNSNKTTTLFEVGNGTSTSARKNAFEVYSDGSLSTDNGTTKVKLENVVQKPNPRSSAIVYQMGSGKYDLIYTISGVQSGNVVTFSTNGVLTFGSNDLIEIYSSIPNETPTITQLSSTTIQATFSTSDTRTTTMIWRPMSTWSN